MEIQESKMAGLVNMVINLILIQMVLQYVVRVIKNILLKMDIVTKIDKILK